MQNPVALPTMAPMSFAPSVSLADQLKQLGTMARPAAKMAGTALRAPPTAGAPMNIGPAATNAGTNMPQPGIMQALQGMSPQGVLGALRGIAGQPAPGLPGSVALQSAGMLSPAGASGIPLNLMPGG